MSLEDINSSYNESPPTNASGIFGIDANLGNSKVIIFPVSWDATSSYGVGSSLAPSAIFKASYQLDLEDPVYKSPHTAGIYMCSGLKEIADTNIKTRENIEKYRNLIFNGFAKDKLLLNKINNSCKRINDIVYENTKKLLQQKKIVSCLGGDHSSPYGFVKALAEVNKNFGVLHIDAHHDLRIAYEDFTYSHASIMYNLLEDFTEISKLVSVGIRDYSKSEKQYAINNKDRVKVFTDHYMSKSKFDLVPFKHLVSEIISHLPHKVYISFDIDGLDVRYCPSTGTPVPGGLDYDQAIFIIDAVVASGREIIGFDLSEVSPDKNGGEWDANVGARILYKLCAASLCSNGIIKTTVSN